MERERCAVCAPCVCACFGMALARLTCASLAGRWLQCLIPPQAASGARDRSRGVWGGAAGNRGGAAVGVRAGRGRSCAPRGGAKLKIAAPPRYDQGKTGDFLNSLKVLGSGGKNAALFDTSPQDLDGLPAQEITKIHQKEEAAHRKAEEAATAKAAAAKAQTIKAHKPSLAEIKLDRAAAKEGDKLLAEDRKTAAEELSSPEKAVHQMMSQDLPLVKARQAAFQAHVKKMAFADKVLEERRREYEAAQAKKVKGFVSSQDAAYEKSLAAAVKRETAGHNEYNTIYSSMENQVEARDRDFSECKP